MNYCFLSNFQVLLGSFPIAQVRDPISVVHYIASRIDISRILKLQLSEEDMDTTEWTSYLICKGKDNILLPLVSAKRVGEVHGLPHIGSHSREMELFLRLFQNMWPRCKILLYRIVSFKDSLFLPSLTSWVTLVRVKRCYQKRRPIKTLRVSTSSTKCGGLKSFLWHLCFWLCKIIIIRDPQVKNFFLIRLRVHKVCGIVLLLPFRKNFAVHQVL